MGVRSENKIIKFLSLPWSEKTLFLESLFYLIFAYIALKLTAWKRILPMIGELKKESAKITNPGNTEVLNEIKVAMKRAHSAVPLGSKCFIMAIGTRLMLNRRKITSTIYIGFKKGNEDFEGHAWIRSEDIILAGGAGRNDYEIIAYYS